MTKLYFQTHGCSTNQSESEIMMGLLSKAGFEIVDDAFSADILVINICTVKGEETALREIRKLNEAYSDKKLIVAGCITKTILREARRIKEEISFINTHNIKSIAEVVEEALHDNIIEAVGADSYKKINLPRIRNNPVVGIIPILNSCAGYCSYCSVRYVKGRLMSYPVEDVRREAVKAVDEGCRELWITSQDNSAYMLEHGRVSRLPELINEVISIDGNFLLRIGMMNPGNLLKVLPGMIEAYKNEKVFKFLHIPVQSGNNEIISSMKRRYTVEDFRKIVNEFRAAIPKIAISTDIIAGFPGETEEQFNDSLNLIKEIKPDVLNISRFHARPGTEAAKMEQVDGAATKNRSRVLTDIFTNISRMNNEAWLNWQGKVLIDERGKADTWIGRNKSYKPVVVSGNLKLGEIAKVKVTGITPFDLRGELV